VFAICARRRTTGRLPGRSIPSRGLDLAVLRAVQGDWGRNLLGRRLSQTFLVSVRMATSGSRISRSVSLADGLAAVISINDNLSFADWPTLSWSIASRPLSRPPSVGASAVRRRPFEGWRLAPAHEGSGRSALVLPSGASIAGQTAACRIGNARPAQVRAAPSWITVIHS
jgi:hypothetical protein